MVAKRRMDSSAHALIFSFTADKKHLSLCRIANRIKGGIPELLTVEEEVPDMRQLT